AGSPKTVVIEITADDTVTYTGIIKNSAGTAVGASVIVAAAVLNTDKVKEKKITYTLTASATAPAGAYTLVISATSAGLTSTVDFNLVVAGVVSNVTTATVSLGGHESSSGSSVDLDNGTVMTSALATAANSGVDILYTYSETLAKPVIMNPVYAKESSNITAFAAWVSPNDTKFHKVTTTGVTFESIVTSAQIEALYSATLATEKRIAVAVGDLLVVKTDASKYVLLRIETVSANATGTASIKYSK
ncbi:MAG: hypothetical protein ACM31E_11115, partial [Fibrobacterota bacterium]